MYIPSLVENHIKEVVHYNLTQCHDLKMKYYSLLFNVFCFFFIITIVGSILYYKYKGKRNIKEQEKKEFQKRDYILYNLRKFQNIKNKYITNIPFD
jgi:hypothetical protein|tara:strand:- start:9 stop:296 length:288 start_codon:yes stop_codon:yes gene_type:complete